MSQSFCCLGQVLDFRIPLPFTDSLGDAESSSGGASKCNWKTRGFDTAYPFENLVERITDTLISVKYPDVRYQVVKCLSSAL